MRVLVTTASRHSSTAELGAAIARVLRLRGIDAVEALPGEVWDLSDYDAVVLGSAVYAGRWLPAAVSFVNRLGPQLTTRPVWLFSSGPVGDPPVPTQGPDVTRVVASTRARDHRVLAGRLDADSLGFVARAMVRVVKAPSGDFRNWAEVAAFATEIADSLMGPATVLSPGPYGTRR